jgi:hypothetical protein
MTTRYYNEMNDEISEEEFNSPQSHTPVADESLVGNELYRYNDFGEKVFAPHGFYEGTNEPIILDDVNKERDEIARRTEIAKEKTLTGSIRTVSGGTRTATGTATGTANRSSVNYTQIGELPQLSYDKFTAPVRDENRVSSLRMKASGAGLRELRRQTQSTIASASGLDPTMRRMTLKDALMGYGSGVSKVMSQADQIAQRQYEKEYDDKFKESTMNYQAGMNKANLEYKAKIEKLLFNAQHPSMAQINANERALAAGSTGYGPILYR